MKVISYQWLFFMVVLCACSQLYCLDVFKERIKTMYGEFVLGKPIYQAFVKDEQNLLTKPNVRPVIIAKNYTAPWWISIVSKISPRESLEDYAKDIYREIVENFDDINKDIENNPLFYKVNRVGYLTYFEHNLKPVLNNGSVLNQGQVTANIDTAITILNNYIKQLNKIVVQTQLDPVKKSKMGVKDTSVAEQVVSAKVITEKEKQAFNDQKKALIKKINDSIARITQLKNKPFLSRLERWHRAQQLQRLTDWIHDYNATQSAL